VLYSVFDWNTLQYDYFESGAGVFPGNRAAPRAKFFNDGDGQQPEAVLPLLPEDAVKVGSGQQARGRIAVERPYVSNSESHAGDVMALVGMGAEPPAGSDFFRDNPWLSVGLVVGGSLVAFKLLLAAARRI
jgi:hypothetical protein